MRIREATYRDIPRLAAVIRRSFGDVAERFALTAKNCPRHPSNCRDAWIEAELSRGIAYFLLCEGGAPVGCAAIEKADSQHCYLERLAVLPEHRRRGFGGALVDHAVLTSQGAGASEVSIALIEAHVELRAWYERRGFVATESRNFPHLPFRVLYMARCITPSAALRETRPRP